MDTDGVVYKIEDKFRYWMAVIQPSRAVSLARCAVPVARNRQMRFSPR
jgi:hypothetical protein